MLGDRNTVREGNNMMSIFKLCTLKKGQHVEEKRSLNFQEAMKLLLVQGQGQRAGLECYSSEYCGSHSQWLYILEKDFVTTKYKEIRVSQTILSLYLLLFNISGPRSLVIQDINTAFLYHESTMETNSEHVMADIIHDQLALLI